MFELLLVAFDTGNARVECLRSTTVWALAPTVMLLYMLFSVILLMNMLIALMAKTFNDHWENKKEIYSYLFAQQDMLACRALSHALANGLLNLL